MLLPAINHPASGLTVVSPPTPQLQVLSQVWILSSLVVDSLAISGQTLVAVQLGKGDPVAAREVTDRLLQV